VLLNLFMSIYTRGQKIEDIIDFKNEVSRSMKTTTIVKATSIQLS
jgi:hypothetical protein